MKILSVHDAMDAIRETFPNIPCLTIRHSLVRLKTGTEHEGFELLCSGVLICSGDTAEQLVRTAADSIDLRVRNQEGA